MSIEPMHAARETNDLHVRKHSWDSEFEDFLRQTTRSQGDEPASLREWLDLAEAWKITRTLRECRGNRSAAARTLGIGRRTLYAKMEKLQIAPTWAVGGRPID
jgi:DNA-binding NtrC family response regulator